MKTGQISQDEDGTYYRTDINGSKKKISAFRAQMLQRQSDRGKATNYKFSGIDEAIAGLSTEDISKYIKDEQALKQFAKANGLKGSSAELAQVKSLLKNERSVNSSGDKKDTPIISNTNTIIAEIRDIGDILRKKFGIKSNGSTVTTTTDFMGGVHQYDEEGKEVNNDKETDKSQKKIEEFTTNISKIGGISAMLGGIRGLFGKLKDGLLGSEDGKSEGLLGMDSSATSIISNDAYFEIRFEYSLIAPSIASFTSS
jgi:hypothetical protein